ncbi:MAG: glycosyltransferase family 4 protein [Thermoleophilia bacterium]|nr:glycosyltransferase family 4 protein [Thermoleophilia bacterium]
MRILVVSNFYPPYHVGGYELGCRDVVDALRARGHVVHVVTSTHGIEGRTREAADGIERALRAGFPTRARDGLRPRARALVREIVNRRVLAGALRRHGPDVVYVWSPRFIELGVGRAAEARGVPVCYFVSDGWLAEAAAVRPILPRPRLALRHVQFASEYLKQSALAAGQSVEYAEVIRWGVDTERFCFGTEERCAARLLYVGRLAAEKGLDTALRALRVLLDSRPRDAAPTLTVVGGPHGERHARDEVARLGLDGRVRFRGLVPREELPSIYRKHDVLVFPSIWPEPFSIAVLEAMASGVVVATTLTGGTGEVAVDGVNCVAFAPGDAAACAAALRRVLEDHELARRLRETARRHVEQRFPLETMVDRIEHSLQRAAVGDRRVSELAT